MASLSHSSRRALSGGRSAVLVALILSSAACETVNPVLVDSTLAPTEVFANRSPAEVAVLPVEDGTSDGGAQRHLVFLRQEVMRQLPDRLFTPITPTVVDAALRGVPEPAARESVLAPSSLQRLVGHAREDALFALRVDRWDESRLLTDRRVRFQFQAAMVGADAQLLWSGTIQGEVKAGGVGAAPRDRDGMARDCGQMAIREMLLRLPQRVL